jgi:DnaJ-class molecular chaperone
MPGYNGTSGIGIQWCGKCGQQHVGTHICTTTPLVMGGYYPPERKPYCCPKCNGEGKVRKQQPVSDNSNERECPACHGECVVWG